jgi:O-antigen/teichoic acid export membrane protein
MTRTLGSTAYGQYTIALLPVSIATLFQDLGINTALMRFCSLYRHEGRNKELKTVVVTGLLFSVAISIIISSFMYLFASPIASVFLKRPELTQMVQAAALAVLGGGGLLTTIQAILVGYEMMGLRSFTQILWSIIRTAFTVIFLLIGMGAFGAVLAFSVSQIVTGLLSTLLIFLIIKFERVKASIDWGMLKNLLKYGFPLSLGSLLGGILAQLYNTLMVIFVATDLIGNYGAATNFGILVSFLTVPISTTLFPLFSKFKKTDPQLKTIFRQSVKYTAMITIPVVLVLIALSVPVTRIIYGADYPYAAEYLILYILTYAWEGLGGFSLGSAISGIGESNVVFRTSVYTFITGTVLALILGPIYGMVGILATMIIAPRSGWIYQTIWAKKNLNMTVDWNSTFKIYLTAFTAFLATYGLIAITNFQLWTALITGGLVYFLIYIIGLPISGALKKSDLTQLQSLIEELGPIGKFGSYLLSLLNKYTRP